MVERKGGIGDEISLVYLAIPSVFLTTVSMVAKNR